MHDVTKWLRDPRNVQDTSKDVDVSEYEKFTDPVSNSPLQ